MSSAVLNEEIEVLESIYPTELHIKSEREIRVDVEPEDLVEGLNLVKLAVKFVYPSDYPEALPDIHLETTQGDITDDEVGNLLEGMRTVGEDNLGMAMTFALVSYLREQLSVLMREREETRKRETMERERLAIEAEEARTRGTPVSLESFRAWKAKFEREMVKKREREEDEKLRGLTVKERDEIKKVATRLTGRQLFERNKDLATVDDGLAEEGTVSVDASQFERDGIFEDEEDEDQITFSDSD